jgi:hypothetical protein
MKFIFNIPLRGLIILEIEADTVILCKGGRLTLFPHTSINVCHGMAV